MASLRYSGPVLEVLGRSRNSHGSSSPPLISLPGLFDRMVSYAKERALPRGDRQN
jgi:hypothetical protein